MSRPSTWTKSFKWHRTCLTTNFADSKYFSFFFQWKIQVERYKTDRVSYHLASQITLDLWRQRRKINRNWWSTLSTIRWKLTLGRCWYSPPLEETYKMQKSIKQQEAFPVFSQGLELKRKKIHTSAVNIDGLTGGLPLISIRNIWLFPFFFYWDSINIHRPNPPNETKLSRLQLKFVCGQRHIPQCHFNESPRGWSNFEYWPSYPMASA